MQTISTSLNYNDIALVPNASGIAPRLTNVQTRLSRHVGLGSPFVAATLRDTMEAHLAIVAAQLGGMGVIHRHLTVDDQAQQVLQVKSHGAVRRRHPLTVPPDLSLAEIRARSKSTGVASYPVVDTGGLLIGIVTARDLRFNSESAVAVSDVMTPLERLVTMREGQSIEHARALMHAHRLERILIVNEDRELVGLVSAKDMERTAVYPDACRDSGGCLRVGAAIGLSLDDRSRAAALAEAGVDVLMIDMLDGHYAAALHQIDWVKKYFPHIDVIAGNVMTAETAIPLLDCGVDAIKVGAMQRSGASCIDKAGRVPYLSAILDMAEVADRFDVPLIADGGIGQPGDVAKALSAGASSVILSPVPNPDSALARRDADRDKADVHYLGAAECRIRDWIEKLRGIMGYCGAATIAQLRRQSRFIQSVSCEVSEELLYRSR